LILTGEGMLGLEAAVASLVEPGEPVLVVSNGIFGRGFGDLVARYGGRPVMVEVPFDRPPAPEELEAALAAHPQIRVATLVHCETPTGFLNPVEELLPVLRAHDVITIVDGVSSLGADPVATDAWGVDLLLGASQKALSAPTGLAFLSVSDRAWEKMERRRQPIPGFYTNLLEWKRTWLDPADRSFPYTPAAALLAALDAACDAVLAEGLEQVLARHRRLAQAVRTALRGAGFRLFAPDAHAASGVTAFWVPEGVDERGFRQRLWEEQGVLMGARWARWRAACGGWGTWALGPGRNASSAAWSPWRPSAGPRGSVYRGRLRRFSLKRSRRRLGNDGAPCRSDEGDRLPCRLDPSSESWGAEGSRARV